MSILCLISMITLLTLVSCGGGVDDDLTVGPETTALHEDMVPITFRGNEGVETAVTRAAGTPLSDIGKTDFRVWGSKDLSGSSHQVVFPGYDVNWVANTAYTTTTNTNNWDYILTEKPDQTIKYWDWSAQAYRFFAATNWGGATPATIGEYTLNETYGNTELVEANATYSVSMLVDASPVLDGGKYDKDATDAKLAEAPYFSRLWYSTGNPTDYPDKQFGKPVTLEFVKPYARVRFIYNYVYPREGIKILSQSFKPTDGSGIPRKGVVTVKYPLAPNNTTIEYSIDLAADPEYMTDFTEDYDPEDDTKKYITCDGGWYTVLPNPSQEKSYTLSVDIKGFDKIRTAVVPAEYMQWKPGYSYTYIFKITEEGGVEIGWVEYAVVPWIPMRGSREVYNW